MRDPETRAEWQEAADGAAWLLLLDSARQYGLIDGGPKANVDRCSDLLARAKVLGILPATSEELIARFIE